LSLKKVMHSSLCIEHSNEKGWQCEQAGVGTGTDTGRKA